MRRRPNLDRRVQLTLTPPGKRTAKPAKPAKPSPESLAAGRLRRAIEAREAVRRLRGELDWLD